MHERNRAWVNAIKTYERYMEEFAADDGYPFEEHEDAPGIPDLQASVGSCVNGLKGGTGGHPRYRKTHVRMGKIYRKLGLYGHECCDAINATLTPPKNNAFEIADRRSGRNLENRSDAESNQAMFEIAETFMDSEDYDQAVKFYDRLWRDLSNYVILTVQLLGLSKALHTIVEQLKTSGLTKKIIFDESKRRMNFLSKRPRVLISQKLRKFLGYVQFIHKAHMSLSRIIFLAFNL